MNDSLYLSPGGMRGISQSHSDVATRLSQLLGSAPGASVVESTHGHIADAVYTALGLTLPSREATMGITQTASQTISDLVSKALQLYEQGDAEGAAKLRAAAEVLKAEQEGQGGADGPTAGSRSSDGAEGSGATSFGTSGSAGNGSGGSGTGGANTAGQLAGQVGQQVAQFGQVLAQSVQGLAQIPQQVMQGVQGIVAAAVGAGGTGGSPGDKADPDGKSDGDGKARPGDESEGERPPDDKAQPGDKGAGGEVPHDKAEPGATGHGPAPDVPVHRALPAQTRPQQSPL
jgi:hypothetical protein